MLPLVLLLGQVLSSEGYANPSSVDNFVEPQFYIEAKDCGPDDRSIIFNSASVLPDPIIYPGSVAIKPDMEVVKDVPAEKMMMKLHLLKLEPQKMTVPCLNGMGSCTYDVCNQVIPNNKEQFCNIGVCECPIKKGLYKPKDAVKFEIPNKGGSIFKKLLQGSYEGNITFFHDTTKKVYGCMNMKFSIKTDGQL